MKKGSLRGKKYFAWVARQDFLQSGGKYKLVPARHYDDWPDWAFDAYRAAWRHQFNISQGVI